MLGFLRRLVLRRVVRSALTFEHNARDVYAALVGELEDTGQQESLRHLLDEEELHINIVTEIAEGRPTSQTLEEILANHHFHSLDHIQPLQPQQLSRWRDRLDEALAEERETYRFYRNLGQISKIPVVRLAFKVLADMEREHVEILGRLLGSCLRNDDRESGSCADFT